MGLLCSAIDTTTFKETIARLEEALREVHLLSGLLPICASCKKIRNEHETWQPLESYIMAHKALASLAAVNRRVRSSKCGQMARNFALTKLEKSTHS